MTWWWILYLLLIALALYALVWLIAYYYLAPRLSFRPPPISQAVGEDTFWLTHENGARIEVCWFARERADHGVIFYQHGNAELLSDIHPRLHYLSEITQMAVFAYEYRGYGYSDGRATLANMQQDALLAWDYLIQQGYKATNVIVYGRSLGSSNATLITNRKQPLRAMILEVPMWDAFRIYADLFWTWRSHLENGRRISTISVPTLILYAKDDALIRPWHSSALLKASVASIKQRVGFSCAHAEIPEQVDYHQTLNAFLDTLPHKASAP
ncbi:lysophospholipase [Suttonella sp. R2A3]|uniref:alpha/beta hydrolase n=1 Tax=Suttonella sp. R2A3 TaxID=2908648 RepID=UPI001F172366|nr:alpha/beta fold hydrolase [Suttonella sp. R2A3]UJF24640.1 lysophospholipase [Suttonella sp. R2A3]